MSGWSVVTGGAGFIGRPPWRALARRASTHVEDAAQGIAAAPRWAAEGEPGWTACHISARTTARLDFVIETLGGALGRAPSTTERPIPQGDVRRIAADGAEAERMLGVRAASSVADGLRRRAERS